MPDGLLPMDLPAVAEPVPANEVFPLALYDGMCRAIDAAHAVDEVKDIRDRALAFQIYARQANNIDAERRAAQIRLRAEHRTGELDKQREKNLGGRPHKTGSGEEPVSDGPPTLRDMGISKRQAHDWRKLSDIPKDQFETALADETRIPTTAGIIREATPPDPETVPVSQDALWLWGRLRDFERDGLLAKEPSTVLLTMTDTMLDDVHRLAPRVSAWLKQIGMPDG